MKLIKKEDADKALKEICDKYRISYGDPKHTQSMDFANAFNNIASIDVDWHKFSDEMPGAFEGLFISDGKSVWHDTSAVDKNGDIILESTNIKEYSNVLWWCYEIFPPAPKGGNV